MLLGNAFCANSLVFLSLKRIKRNEPDTYLRLYAAARKTLEKLPESAYSHPDALACIETDEPDKADELDPDSPSNLKSTWCAPSKLKEPETKATRQSSRLNKTEASPQKTNRPSLPRKKTMTTPSKKKADSPGNEVFGSLAEAIGMVDHVVYVDTEHPESHGHGFFCLKVPDALLTATDLGTYVDDELVFMAEDLIDLCDYQKYNGQLVLNGQGLLVTKPSVANYLLNQYLELLALEDEQCDRTEHEFKCWISALHNDKTRMDQTILFVFEDDVVCTTDFNSAQPAGPTCDHNVKFLLRELPLNTEAADGTVIPQVFYPGYFKLRIVRRGKPKMLLVEQAPVKSLASAFEGMKQKK